MLADVLLHESTLDELWRFRVANGGLSDPPQVVGRTLYFTDEKLFYELPLPLL